MLGKKPFPFDLLFWNQDSTRMTAANHNFYLREFYHENRLARGQMTIGGVKLDIGKVKLPDLRAVRQGGPHRAGQVRVHRLAAVRRPGRPTCWRARATSPASSTRRARSSTSTGPTPSTTDDARGVARERRGASRAPGGRTRRSGSPNIRATWIERAPARRQARRHRGRARQLRQGQALSRSTAPGTGNRRLVAARRLHEGDDAADKLVVGRNDLEFPRLQ